MALSEKNREAGKGTRLEVQGSRRKAKGARLHIQDSKLTGADVIEAGVVLIRYRRGNTFDPSEYL